MHSLAPCYVVTPPVSKTQKTLTLSNEGKSHPSQIAERLRIMTLEMASSVVTMNARACRCLWGKVSAQGQMCSHASLPVVANYCFCWACVLCAQITDFLYLLCTSSATKRSGLWWRWSGKRLITATCPQEICFVVLMLAKHHTDHLKNKVLRSCNGHPCAKSPLLLIHTSAMVTPQWRIAVWRSCFHFKFYKNQVASALLNYKIHRVPGVKLPCLQWLFHNLLPTCSLKTHHLQHGGWVSVVLALANLHGHVFCHGALEIVGAHGGLRQTSKACLAHLAHLHDMQNCWHKEMLE